MTEPRKTNDSAVGEPIMFERRDEPLHEKLTAGQAKLAYLPNRNDSTDAEEEIPVHERIRRLTVGQSEHRYLTDH